MPQPRLRLIDHGATWVLYNPLRSGAADPAAVMPSVLERYDRAPRTAASAGIIAGIAVFGLLCLTTPVVGALISGLATGVVLAAVIRWHSTRSLTAAEQSIAALDETLGPRKWSSASLRTPAVQTECDAAKQSALTISTSRAVSRGALGDPDMILTDLNEALWEITQRATAVDARNHLHRNTTSQLANTGDATDNDLLSVADAALNADLIALHASVQQLDELAARVNDIDTALNEPTITHQLHAVIAPIPTDVDPSALERLSAQLDAADIVLRHGGSRPDPDSDDRT